MKQWIFSGIFTLTSIVACKTPESRQTPFESSRAEHIAKRADEPRSLESIFKRLNIDSDFQIVLTKLSQQISDEVVKAAKILENSIKIIQDGTPDEKANLLVSFVKTATLSSLSSAAFVLSMHQPDKAYALEAAMSIGLEKHFEKSRQKITDHLKKNQFPSLRAAIKSYEEFADLAQIYDPHQVKKLKTFLPPEVYTSNDALALTSRASDCSIFKINGQMRTCSKQDIGNNTMDFATGMIWAVGLSFVVSRTVAITLLIANVSIYIYGAYLAFGTSVF